MSTFSIFLFVVYLENSSGIIRIHFTYTMCGHVNKLDIYLFQKLQTLISFQLSQKVWHISICNA